jgi:predicted esterase
MLHGAGGDAKGSVASLADLAENFGVVVLAPDSRSSTWDRIESGFGPDVRFIDYALKHTFQMCAIDPLRLAIAGFSDGASYSLTMGLINGDLFSHVIAFSPGFMTPSELHGQPRIFISHGALDRVLDIDHCSRRIVNKMRAQGFDVDYREFEDGHSIPDRIAHEAIEWFVRYPV